MPKYLVELTTTIEVEAKDESEAVDKADMMMAHGDCSVYTYIEEVEE